MFHRAADHMRTSLLGAIAGMQCCAAHPFAVAAHAGGNVFTNLTVASLELSVVFAGAVIGTDEHRSVLVAIGIEAVVVDHPPPDRVVVRIYLRHMVNIRTEAIP